MSLVSVLVGFGLRQALGKEADSALEYIQNRFTDHSQALPKAIVKANDRAWAALAIALAGEGLFDQLKMVLRPADEKAFGEQVREFLRDNHNRYDGEAGDFRKKCLSELHQAKRDGLLSADLTAEEVKNKVGMFQRYADPTSLVQEGRKVVGQIADDLKNHYPSLAELVRRPSPSGGSPLLIAAFSYFFRREVEMNAELAHGLLWDNLQMLSASQANGFSQIETIFATHGKQVDAVLEVVLDLRAELERLNKELRDGTADIRAIYEAVMNLLGKLDLHEGEAKLRRRFEIKDPTKVEREVVRLLDKFRKRLQKYAYSIVRFECPHCQWVCQAEASRVGQSTTCQKCSRELVIPECSQWLISFKCPHCQSIRHTEASQIGARIPCPKCKQSLLVPKVSKWLIGFRCPICRSLISGGASEVGQVRICPEGDHNFQRPNPWNGFVAHRHMEPGTTEVNGQNNSEPSRISAAISADAQTAADIARSCGSEEARVAEHFNWWLSDYRGVGRFLAKVGETS